jgi:hypothetical protein
MKESDLYAPLKAWFEAQGYRIVAEVPMIHQTIDAVAIRDGVVVAIEMKLCLTEAVIRQGSLAQTVADKVYVAVGTNPRAASVVEAKRYGLGVLSIRGGVVTILQDPSPNEHVNQHWREMALAKATHMRTDTIGGVPCRDGVGPARDCKRRVEEYKKQNPKTTWKEIYENVPNHYANAKSMAGALGYSMRQRDHWKEMRKKERARK